MKVSLGKCKEDEVHQIFLIILKQKHSNLFNFGIQQHILIVYSYKTISWFYLVEHEGWIQDSVEYEVMV